MNSGSRFQVSSRGKIAVGLAAALLTISRADAQTNPATVVYSAGQPARARQTQSAAVRAEEIRAACLQGRRCICGRVLKVFPTGVLVESGYPGLLRDSLHGAWHLPGTVLASRDTNLVEKLEPDSLCVGTVFLTDLPKLRGAKIAPYDYVVLHSYPAGEFTYSLVGNIQHTVRRFAGGLETAVRLVQQSEPANSISAK